MHFGQSRWPTISMQRLTSQSSGRFRASRSNAAHRRVRRHKMRIHDLQSVDGQPHAFEIANLLLTRAQACRIAKSIPGSTLIRQSRLLRDQDLFCEFTLGDETFIIEEPHGDNSRFFVGSKDGISSESLLLVREAFDRHRWWHAPSGMLAMVLLLSLMALVSVTAYKFIALDCLASDGKSELGAKQCVYTTK